jgi:flagellar protein FlgJ
MMTNISPVMTRLQAPSGREEISMGNAAGRKEGTSALLRACQDFEALFVYQLLKTMRKATPAPGGFRIPGQDTYEMLMDQQIANKVSKKGGGLGLARALYEKMAPLVEKKDREIKEKINIAD